MRFRVPFQGMSIFLGLTTILFLAGCGSGIIPTPPSTGAAGGSPGSGSSGSSGGSGSAPGTGSGGNNGGSGSTPVGPSLTGVVESGGHPIVSSNVYLYAAGTSGYGTGAASLLSSYVVTDKDGSFSIPTSSFNCPSNSQIYLVAVGGDAGSGSNSNATLMTALGSCSGLDPGSSVHINEVTTVASAYALSQFMLPGSTAVGTSSTNTVGLVNAFDTVTNLVDITTGAARSTTPASNGTVPQTTINGLANIIASCVNSDKTFAACTSLFSAVTPSGKTAPTDTLGAILNIALNSGFNVQALYNLAASSNPFQPGLTGPPNDWTLSVEYTGGGLNSGQLLAADSKGNLWVPNSIDPGTISEFSPLGAPLSGSTGFSGGGLSYPQSLAIDLTGNVWSANSGDDSVSKHSPSGMPLSGNSGFTAPGLLEPLALAIDGSGNVFTVNDGDNTNTVTKLDNSGNAVAQFTNGGLSYPYAVAVDANENIWVANFGVTNNVSKFSNTGTAASVSGFTGGGIHAATGIAIDANGNAWIANLYASVVSELSSTGSPLSGSGYATPAPVSYVAVDGNNTVWTANSDGSVSHLASNGTALSPDTGYISTNATGAVGIAIDASGNVWTTDNSVNSLFEYIGVASPSAMPLQQAVKNNTLGQRP
jgi:hypothetical protein